MHPSSRTLLAALIGSVLLPACTYVSPTELAGASVSSASPLAVAPAAKGVADGLVANNAGSLTGTLHGPAPTLIANNAAGLIANAAGSLIANNAAGLVGNGAANVARMRRYGVAATAGTLSTPAAGAEVGVYDASGNRLSAGSVVTDAEGRFHVSGLQPSGGLVFVRATYQAEGHAVVLAAVAAAPREPGVQAVAISPASTLVAKKLDFLIAQRALATEALAPERLTRLAIAMEAALDAEDVVAAAVLPTAQAASFFDRTMQRRPELLQALRRLDADQADRLTMPGPGQPPLPRLAAVEAYLGAASPGLLDGAGEAARFAFPLDVAADADGNLYVADSNNHCVRRVSPSGVVETLAGNGQPGAVGGRGAEARFNSPRGVAVDATGAVYVADAGNQLIRRIAPGGDVSVFAGNGRRGLQDGPAAEAMFDGPQGLAIDAAGHLYVADTGNRRVRRIAPDGQVSTVMELAEAASPDVPAGPYDVAVDRDGRLYVADAGSNAIWRREPGGGLQVLAGGPQGLTDGTGIGAAFKYPVGLAIGPDGHLYVADRDNHSVRRISPQGAVVTLAGNGRAGAATGVGAEARFHTPGGIAIGPDGTLYLADTFNHAVRRLRLPAP